MNNDLSRLNRDLIKKLARLTIRNGNVDKRIAKYVLLRLSRKELIFYLSALKGAIYKNSVRAISSQELPPKTEQSISTKFKDRLVFFEQDQSQSEGIKIIIDDTIIDLTINGYINTTLEQLKT